MSKKTEIEKDVHYFNTNEAVLYGIEKAVLLYNFRYWLKLNRANQSNRHKKNGVEYYWTYNTTKSFSELFPYLPEGSIQRWLKDLEKAGAIIVSRFNKHKYDKTKWYTLPEFQIGDTLHQNGESNNQNGDTIPDSNTQIENTHTSVVSNNSEESKEKKFYSFIGELTKLRDSPRHDLKVIALYWSVKGFVFENEEQFKAGLKRELRAASLLKGYSGTQIAQAIEYCKKNYDVWTLETCAKRIADLINKK